MRHFSDEPGRLSTKALVIYFVLLMTWPLVAGAQSTPKPPPTPAADTAAVPPSGDATTGSTGPEDSSSDISSTAQKTKWQAIITREEDPAKQIQGLKLISPSVPVFLIQKESKLRSLVVVEFEVAPSPGQILISGKIPLAKTRRQGRERLYAYLQSRRNDVSLSYVVNKKTVRTEKITILSPDAQEYSVASPWDSLRLALGSTLFGYKQTGYDDFFSWNGLISLQYHSPEKNKSFGYNVDLDATVLTAKSNHDGYSPQLLTGKLDGVYYLESDEENLLRYHFLAGFNYLTIFSNGAPFGVKNLITTDVGFRARYVIDKKSDYYGGARLAVFDTKFKDLGFELEFSRSLLFKTLHRSEIGFKFLNYSYHPGDATSVNIKTYSVFLSYSL